MFNGSKFPVETFALKTRKEFRFHFEGSLCRVRLQEDCESGEEGVRVQRNCGRTPRVWRGKMKNGPALHIKNFERIKNKLSHWIMDMHNRCMKKVVPNKL